MWRYEHAPGLDPQTAPPIWPAESRMKRVPGRASLLMFAHPQCPCSSASLGELALLMTHLQGITEANVIFYRPPELPVDWHETALWNAAAKIPGLTVRVDEDGLERRLFGIATSGHTLLYDEHGALQFSGGITAARGHSGDNAGRTAILSLLRGTRSGRDSTFVFGCSLFNRPAADGTASGPALK